MYLQNILISLEKKIREKLLTYSSVKLRIHRFLINILSKLGVKLNANLKFFATECKFRSSFVCTSSRLFQLH